MSRFVYYNRNPDGEKAEDCVIRAISFASNLPYSEIRKKLWLTAELYDCNRLCKFCYGNFITNVLKYKEVNCDGYTVGKFADDHPYGTYLIRVPSHLTVISNGDLYDIWDCRSEICDMVWKRVD